MFNYRQFFQFIFITVLMFLIIAFNGRVNAITIEYLTEQGELFNKVLAQAKLTPLDVKIDNQDISLWGGDKYKFNLLNAFFDNPWKISPYTRTLTDQILNNQYNLPLLTYLAQKRTDNPGINPAINQTLLEKYQAITNKLGDDVLAIALNKLTNQPVNNFKNEEYTKMPVKLRSAIAQFLLTIPDTLTYRKTALLSKLNPLKSTENTIYERIFYLTSTTAANNDDDQNPQNTEDDLLIENLLNNVNYHLLNTGSILIISAVQELEKQINKLEKINTNFNYQIDTELGKIIINNRGDQTYPDDDYLLIIDLKGNDTYLGGSATRNIAHGISVTIDFEGNDHYENTSEKNPSFGAGIFGYGILIDEKGNDEYTAKYISQGSGIFGTGILADYSGNDIYKGIAHVQASGTYGTGLLIDNQGSDRYFLYRLGQGYGFTKGVGLLLDIQGDDQYIGLEDKYPNGGPFGAEKHLHFAQGFGLGKRNDTIDGNSWGGGIGILIDGTGNDRYECDIYCQGSAYWYSMGILTDKSGNDYHNGGAYSLAGVPHFALGIYQDDGGNDEYTGFISQSLGKGRDFAIGWFEESEGNDWYQSSYSTLGSADINGIGVFWDKKGDDTYLSLPNLNYGSAQMEASSGTSQKESPGLRQIMFTLGLFVDGEGQDKYLLSPKEYKPDGKFQIGKDQIKNLSPHPIADNQKTWCNPVDPRPVKRAFGCGIDN
jgi:hypothetical protein